MKRLTLKRHLRESFHNLKRNGWMSVAAISAVTVTLLLVGVLFSLLMNINKIASDVENNVQVRVIIQQNTSKANKRILEKNLKSLKNVKSVSYSSKEQELKRVIGTYGNSFKLLKGDNNPLYDTFIVKAKEPKQTVEVAKLAKTLDGVYDARYGGDSAKKIFRTVATIQRVGLIIAILLLFVAVFLISNTIRITILSRSEEIKIMRLVGATNSYIRWPFMFEGAWVGIFGSLVPILVVDIGYYFIYRSVAPRLASGTYNILPPHTFLGEIDILMFIIAIVIGALGSGISMRRFLKI